MKAYLEITEWDSEFAVPNHVYFLNDGRDKMYGYVRASDGVVQTMRTPYRFHVRGRKFREVKNVWNFGVEEVSEGFVKIVIGSKGERYTITEVNNVRQCSCPGFKFRGKCRHTES